MNFLTKTFEAGRTLSNILPLVLKTGVRTKLTPIARKRQKPHQVWPNKTYTWPGGQKYFGFTYYPRYPDQEDPDWKPTELFMIQRVKSPRGRPYWEKRILRNLRIEQERSDLNIVINCPQTNKSLWKVKHLIKITPVTFPNGYPTEADISKCHLHANGELKISPHVGIETERIEATETYQRKTDRLDGYSMQKYLRNKWEKPYMDFLKFN